MRSFKVGDTIKIDRNARVWSFNPSQSSTTDWVGVQYLPDFTLAIVTHAPIPHETWFARGESKHMHSAAYAPTAGHIIIRNCDAYKL